MKTTDPLQLFMAAFSAAAERKPIPAPPQVRTRNRELTDADKERIRKAILKNQRKEQKRNEQRERSKRGQTEAL